MIFQGLAENFQDMFLEFGQFVQKQNPVVRQADLAGPGKMTAADQARIGYGVVGRAERPSRDHGLIFFQHAGHAEDLGGFDGLVKADGRKDRGDAFGQHGFSGTRRADHDQVVPAGSGHFQGALGQLLSHDFGIIRIGFAFSLKQARNIGFFRIDPRIAPEKIDDLGQGGDRKGQDVLNHGRFQAVLKGNDDGRVSGLFCRNRHGKRAVHRFDAAVQGQFPQNQAGGDRFCRNQPGRGQNADGNGQVKSGAFLLDAGRRQIHRNPVVWKRVPGIVNGGADPLLALLTDISGSPTMVKLGRP